MPPAQLPLAQFEFAEQLAPVPPHTPLMQLALVQSASAEQLAPAPPQLPPPQPSW
jgi:hypothetical protein